MEPSPPPLDEAASAALSDFADFMGYIGGAQGLAHLVAALALCAGAVVGIVLTGGFR